MSSSSSPLLSRIAAYRSRRRASKEGGKRARLAQSQAQQRTDASQQQIVEQSFAGPVVQGVRPPPPPHPAAREETERLAFQEEQLQQEQLQQQHRQQQQQQQQQRKQQEGQHQQQQGGRQDQRRRPPKNREVSRSQLRGRIYSPKPAAGPISTSQQFKPGMITEEDDEDEEENQSHGHGVTAGSSGFIQQAAQSLLPAEAWPSSSVTSEDARSIRFAPSAKESVPHERIVVSRSQQVVMSLNKEVRDSEDRLSVPTCIGDLRSNPELFREIVTVAVGRANGSRAQKNQVARMGFEELSNTLAKLDAVNFKISRRAGERTGLRRGAHRSSKRGARSKRSGKPAKRQVGPSQESEGPGKATTRNVEQVASTKGRPRPRGASAAKAAGRSLGDSSRNGGKGGAWDQEDQGWLERVFNPEESDFNKDSVIVAIRLRPPQHADDAVGADDEQRRGGTEEATLGPSVVVEGDTITVLNEGSATRREKRFTFDHCYDSSRDSNDSEYG